MATPNEYEYVKNAGAYCPVCGSDQITGHDFNVDLGVVSQRVSCDTCESYWVDKYDLVGFGEMEVGEIPED